MEKLNAIPSGDGLNESATNEIFDASEKVEEFDEEDLPVLTELEPPHLIISHNGAVVRELQLSGPRTLLGRSEMSDVVIDNQYVSTYVPIYVGTMEIDPLFKTYDPDEYSDMSARWAIDFVDNLLYLKWQDAVKDLWEARDPIEQAFFDKQADIEKEALIIYEKDPVKARQYLTDYTKKSMQETVAMYQALQKTLISKYTNNKQGL